MDNLTHGLTGALMGQAGLKKKTGLGLVALVLGANLPDIDVVSLFWLDSKEALGFRRGITHGPIGLALLPLGLAALLWGFDRWQERRGKRPDNRGPVSFKWLYILGLVGAISHSLMDWLNVYGVRFLYPFDTSWYYGDTLFILDVWLWALLIAAVWWSARREKRSGSGARPAWIGIVVGLVYIGVNWAWSTTTYAGAKGQYAYGPEAEVIVGQLPLMPWSREIVHKQPDGIWRGGVYTPWQGIEDKPLSKANCAMPQLEAAREQNSQLNGFLVWSRAPFAERAEDGSVVLRDARFTDPRLGDRFSMALPDVECVELEAM